MVKLPFCCYVISDQLAVFVPRLFAILTPNADGVGDSYNGELTTRRTRHQTIDELITFDFDFDIDPQLYY